MSAAMSQHTRTHTCTDTGPHTVAPARPTPASPVRTCVAAVLSAAFWFGFASLPDTARAHGDEDHSQDAKAPGVPTPAAQPPGNGPQRLADGSVFMPKTVQYRLGVRTQPARTVPLATTQTLQGHVVADPDSGGRVQAPFAGSVLPGPKGMPVAGQRVAKGEVVAYLRPLAGALERGNQQALLAELDAQLAVAQGRVNRLAQLSGAVPQKDIDTARIERDALARRRGFISTSIDHAEPVRAPAAGTLSALGGGQLRAGQIVDARDTLFDIVDPQRLAIEALAYDPQLATTLRTASARAGEQTLALRFVGGGLQLREQALPLLFRITTRDATLAVGQPVTVWVQAGRTVPGTALPRQALAPGNAGDTTVWVHTEAERFVARRVRTQPLDATHVAVVDGLHEGERVVTEGASLLSQVR